MSQSKSSKAAEQELMWEKLSTEYVPPFNGNGLTWYQQQLGRALCGGVGKGELVVIAARRGAGKTMYFDIESTIDK